jgi:hypothetical protein
MQELIKLYQKYVGYPRYPKLDVSFKILDKIVWSVVCLGKPFKPPNFPPFPIEKLQNILPFHYTGVDIFGHYFLKTGAKAYGCIFLCLQTRAIQLKYCKNITAETISHCFRHIIYQRGTSDLILSNNGSQLKTLCNHITQTPPCTWKFSTQLSLFENGFF